MEKKHAHLEMVQGVVNRLSHNSFLLKGWSVLLVSALFALAAGKSKPYFIYLAYFPAIAFWILDGYFLWQERLFRALYDRVREMKEEDIDFSMNTTVVRDEVKPWRDVVFSLTLLLLHATVVASIVIVMIVWLVVNKGAPNG